MALPHFENIREAPGHLVTRAGLKQQGVDGLRPEPVATVLQFGKVVFLYDLRSIKDRQPAASGPARRVRAKF